MRFHLLIALATVFLASTAVFAVSEFAVEETTTSSDTIEESTTEATIQKQTEVASTEESKKTKKADKKKQPKRVTVEEGDTLASIAEENGTTYERLFYANTELEHPDLIEPGDTLLIPAPDEELETREIPEPIVQEESAPAPVTNSAPAPAVASGSVWDRLAECESGGNWSINTGNGYYGGLQFSYNTWQSVKEPGYPEYAHQATREQQIFAASKLGWHNWPHCSEELGLR